MLLIVFSNTALAITDTFTNPEDSYGRSSSPATNYGSETSIIADGVAQDPGNGAFGEVAGILKWDVSSIPATASVTSATVTINLTNNSSGEYHFLSQTGAWSEATVSWSDFNFGASILGIIPSFTFGSTTINLNASGIALVQGWVDGSIANDGMIVRTGGTNNSIAFQSNESGGSPASLEVTYSNGGPQTLEERVAFLEALLANVTRNGNNLHFNSMNVHINNGLGATNGNAADPEALSGTTNGLGNLIVGYDEPHQDCVGEFCFLNKNGSHNVVIGHGNSYTNTYGGLVVGIDNAINGKYASVTGGLRNVAQGRGSHVSGGLENNTTGENSTVSGGNNNAATGENSSVSGGQENEARGPGSSVSGGNNNTAIGDDSSVSGGLQNVPTGTWASVSGGSFNEAIGSRSSISGGTTNKATEINSSISGGMNNTASGFSSSVSGGSFNEASGARSSISGGRSSEAGGDNASVSGGASRSAAGGDDWVAGSLFEDF